jgi:hypothetical protein
MIFVDMTRGLDARYMISRLRPKKFKVLSLTTIATPHRGMLRPWNNPRLFTQTIQVLRLQIMSLSELVVRSMITLYKEPNSCL